MQSIMNRRKFIQSGLLLSAPALVPARLFGKYSPSNTLNIGIVGCGIRFKAHARNFQKIPGCRVKAVCDIYSKRVEKSVEKINTYNKDTDCAGYHDFRDLCANPEIDIVAVAAPDHWHALIAIEAAKNGKHIYLEKPFAYSIEEGRAVVDAVKRSGVILQHGTQQRSMASFQKATYLSRHGYIGNVDVAYAISPAGPQGGDTMNTEMPAGFDFDFFTGPAPVTPWYNELAFRKGTPAWYFTSAFGAGWVTAWGSHHVDSAQFALGKDTEAPIKVEAEGAYPNTGVFDTPHSWYAEFTYADGKKLIYCTSDRPEAPKKSGNMLVIGDEGAVAANRKQAWGKPANLLARSWPKNDPALQLIETGGERDHFANFIDVIRYGSYQNGSMEVGNLSTKLCHLTSIGIETQRPMNWDDPNERFIDDPQADRLLGRTMRAPWTL
jgi:predicted dehydrogenase